MFIALFLIFLILLAVELFAPNATATPSSTREAKSLVYKAPFKLERSDQTTTTTTTSTTTLSPVKKKVAQPATLTAARQVAAPTGDWTVQCRVWMTQAGIPTDVHDVALKLIDKESDCGATAQNPHSTAYGIGQFLDSTWKGVNCVKTSEPVEQLRCMALYVVRHGGWQGSLNFRINNGWY